MKIVQDMLGHSSITITADTYASVLPEVARSAAESAAGLIPRQRRSPSGLTSGSQRPSTARAETNQDRNIA
jgi:hypothetical protein